MKLTRAGALLPALLAGLLVACGSEESQAPAEATYTWDLPPGFPTPKVPRDNPMSEVKVELGRRLFYDTRLSGNETFACGSCHLQKLAFSDGKAQAVGSTGEVHRRGSMSLVNAAYNPALTWANPLMDSLERQALVPMFGEFPVELGLANREDEVLGRLREDAAYPGLFAKAFPGEAEPISIHAVTLAIAAFERTIISGRSAYDRYANEGDASALSEPAKRGMDLFFSELLECHHCHGGFNFSSSVMFEGKAFDELFYQNTGLYNVDGKGGYPAQDTGLYEITGSPEDMGRYRAPTLRNIELTAPYMHDGSIATLEEAIEGHYARGGRLIEAGPFAGDGRQSPLKSIFLEGFALSARDRDDLVAFLKSLTDRELLQDPRLSDPFAPAGADGQ